MPRKILLTGLYTDVHKAADALDGLRLLGLREEDIQDLARGAALVQDAWPAPHP